jgi:hypothetical protein
MNTDGHGYGKVEVPTEKKVSSKDVDFLSM